MRKINFSFVVFAIIAFFTLNLSANAQVAAGSKSARPLITQNVDDHNLISLPGNTHPAARNSKNDRGAVKDDFQLHGMQIQLKRSPEQEKALGILMDQLHTPGNANYHKWLSEADWRESFGINQDDVKKVVEWLKSYGFKVDGVKDDGMVISYSGTAAQVREAFHTEIHNLVDKNGAKHFGNISDPKIPAAFKDVMVGPTSLSNFFPHPLVKKVNKVRIDEQGDIHQGVATGKGPHTEYTFSPACGITGSDCWAIVPGDAETIYNTLPLYTASTPITGKGQTIGLIEDSDYYKASDWTTFVSTFGLTTYGGTLAQNHPSGPNTCTDPGDVAGTDLEVELDIEYATAMAPGAAVAVESCADTSTVFGGLIAVQNLASATTITVPVQSMSYGECEVEDGAAVNASFNAAFQQAAARGISLFVSSGDENANSCDADESYAENGITVSGWTSTPYNVSVGGTDFGDTYAGTNSTYWNTTNGTYYNSAKSYIPEIPWNDSCASQLIATKEGYTHTYGASGFCASATGEDFWEVVGGSGGPSNCYSGSSNDPYVANGTCAGQPKPSWQVVYGNPSDGVRDIPDVSLFAANGVWGHYIIMCYSNTNVEGGAPCTGAPSGWTGIGGTSASSPMMAGIMALIEEKTGEVQGDANYVLYSLANTEYGSSGSTTCNSSNGTSGTSGCVFYDITQGDNNADCYYYSTSPLVAYNCYEPDEDEYVGVGSLTDTAYSPIYNTEKGWDFATGIGSVNAVNLVAAWAGYSNSAPTVAVTASPTYNNAGGVVTFAVTVTGSGSYPTGSIAFTISGTSGTVGTATLPTSTNSSSPCTTSCSSSTSYAYTIPAGTAAGVYTVTANYTPVNEQYPTGASGTATYNVVTGTSSTTLSANPTAATIGSGVAIVFTSTTTYGNDGTTTPTGTVTLTAPGAGTLATLPVSGSSCTINGTAKTITCTYSWTPNYGGTLVVTSTYSGDTNYAASHGSTTITVTKLATSITSSANPTTVTAAAPSATFTATVSYASSTVTEPSPTGTVAFELSGAAFETMNVSACTINTTARTISCQYTYTYMWDYVSNGTYTLTAVYSGDNLYATSTSAGSTFVVAGEDADTTTISLATASSVYATGGTTVATIVVKGTAGDGHTTGTVTVTGSGSLGTLATIVLNTTNCTATNGYTYTCKPTLTIPAGTPVAAYTITASYPGDVNYEPSSGTATYTVTQATPTAAIAAASGTYGSTITLSATNTGVTNGVAPTGAATFKVNGVTAPGTATCSGSGVVETCTLSYQIDLAPASYSTGVSFAADTNYKAATATGTLTSSKQTPTAAMVSPVSTSPVTQTQGALSAFAVSGTLSWTGSGTAPTKADISATSTAPGTFSALSCTAGTLVYNCSGTFTPTSTDTAGNYNINISFSGDANYASAASTQAGNYVINAATTPTVTLSPVSAPYGSTAGQSITVTATGDNGAIATFGTTGGVGGSFSPTTCTIASNTCSTSYIPSGTLAVGTYTNDLTVTVAAHGSYGPGSGASTLTITTTKGDIGFSSVTHNMGSVAIGNSTRYTVAVYNNTGAAIPFTAVQLVTTASPNPFATQNNCGTSIPTTGCEIAFTYTPVAGDSGTETATWSLTGTPGGTTFNPSNGGTLTGTVATSSGVTLTTAGHNFGDVTVGTTSPTYGTVLTNSTNAAVTLTLGSVSSPFAGVTNCPASLGAGVSCNLQFTFSPTTTGIIQQVYSLAANGGAVPITVGGTPVTGITLTGTGD